MPESFWDSAKAEPKGPDFRKAYDDLSAFKAEIEVKRNTLPKSVADYKAELPKDFTAPEGIKYELKSDDPLLNQARAFMFDIDSGKISGQEAFSRMLALNAAAQVNSQQQIRQARDAEIAKLGPTAPARIDAVSTWMKAKLGDELAGAWNQMMVTAKHVELGEQIIKKFTSQGSADFSQQHRTGGSGEPTAEQWKAMSYSERRDYGRTKTKAA